MLSTRCSKVYLEAEDFLMSNFGKTAADPFDPVTNPKGFVNLGTCVNALLEEELEDYLNGKKFNHVKEWQHYNNLSGHENVKETVAEFLTERLHTPKAIEGKNLNFQAGVSTLLESLAFALADPGDVFVIMFPSYPRFRSDISERAEIKLMGPALRAENDFMLRPNDVDNYIMDLKSQGFNVKAYIHCNPNNPLGDVYNEETNLKLMKICAKHQIHFISDEIYALTIHNSKRKDEFKSVLCMENVPDPQRTHFLWGFSKDFGLASFRFGVLHTFNKDLMKIMEGMCLYSSVEGHIQQMGGRMLQDKKWLDETYFPMNLKRVRSAFEDCKSFFEKHGCQVRDSPAGLFAWVNLSQFLPFKKNERNITEKSERQLFMELLNNYKLYIPMGTPFGSQDPGWFRVIISIRRDHWNEFCKRFDDFVRCKKNVLNK